LGPSYSSNSVGGPDGGSQQSLASRHTSMLGGSQEADAGGYRTHPQAVAHYGGQYSSVYGSAALSGAQQVSGLYFLNSFPFLVTYALSYLCSTKPHPRHFTWSCARLILFF
jgi:hypothetical protein